MKIQYASDLHLEFGENTKWLKQNPIVPVGDVLVLAGDIGYLGDDNYSKHPFWDWASENFKQVIVVMGNHEFYKFFDITNLYDGYKVEIRHNITAYYNSVIHLEGVDIVASTLWSEIPLKEAAFTERVISDFRRILYDGELLTFANFNNEHRRCFEFIKNAVESSKAKHIIVATHHVPSFELMSKEFECSSANGAFTVEHGDFIADSRIDYWIYGHSHRNINKMIGSTRCVSNQLGYVFQNEHGSFNPMAVIEV